MAKKYGSLKKSLLSDLAERGLDEPIYIDMVSSYIELLEIRDRLTEDIAVRGVVVISDKKGETDNPSIQRRIQVQAQLNQIYSSLGFRDKAVKAKSMKGADDAL